MDMLVHSLQQLMDLPRWFFYSAFGTCYLAYYYYKVVKPPILACSTGKYRLFLESNVPILKQKFWPTIWCFESRMQTVIATILRNRPEIPYEREVLKLEDGGQVGLDWVHPEKDTPDVPVIVILPGLIGASQSDYVRGLVLNSKECNFRTVVFNNRGLGGITLTTPQTYCASNSKDLTEVLLHVRSRYPNAPVAATGISMGGLILGNYLSSEEQRKHHHVCAAMLISVPFDVFKASDSIECSGLNLMLNKHLAKSLCQFVENVRHILEPVDKWNFDDVIKSKTIREFDSKFTSKQFGYNSVDEYYHDANLHTKLANIKTPVLCLNAADDPFQPLDTYSVDAVYNHENVGIVVTARGGHIGFLEGFWPAKRTEYMHKFFTQFFTAILKDNTYKEFSAKPSQDNVE